MARAATNSDSFNAVAEPWRREILSYLAREERSVGAIVTGLGLEAAFGIEASAGVARGGAGSSASEREAYVVSNQRRGDPATL